MEPITPKQICNILNNSFKSILNRNKLTIETCGILPDEFRTLATLVHTGFIDKKQFDTIIQHRIDTVKDKSNEY